MPILTVDLASKFSAVCVLSAEGKVLREFDSGDLSPFDFLRKIVLTARLYSVSLVMVEDVPPNKLFTQFMTKPVTRLQGALIFALGAAASDLLDKTLFVYPSEWQKTYEGVARGDEKVRIESARQAAEDLGYAPPDLTLPHIASCAKCQKKPLVTHLAPFKKRMTDYIDAFLMGRWVLSFDSIEALREAAPKTVSPAYI